jgi:MscS family membrane protein
MRNCFSIRPPLLPILQRLALIAVFIFTIQAFAAGETPAPASISSESVGAVPLAAPKAGLVKSTAEKAQVPPAPVPVSVVSQLANLSWEELRDWEGFQSGRLAFLAIGIILALLAGRLTRWIIGSLVKRVVAAKTKTQIDDCVCDALGRPAGTLVVVIGIYLSAIPLIGNLAENVQPSVNNGFEAVAAIVFAWGLYCMVPILILMMEEVAVNSAIEIDDLIISITRKCLKIIVVVGSIVFIGQNVMGWDITALLAGAGVAGLAVAFAAQDTIANFFGSIMVVIDQPFKIGDAVRINEFEGTVLHVGFRSTRIQTSDGHTITIPNKKTADSAIINISRRPNTRHVFFFGLGYETTPAQMEKALAILKEIFANGDGYLPEQPAKIGFFQFQDFALSIRVIAWHHNLDAHGKPQIPDYWRYSDWVSKMNLEVLRRFNEAGLSLAYANRQMNASGTVDNPLHISLNSQVAKTVLPAE